ncbi:MAG TPA: peptidoglycan DD-metalloendopeptidase family protein [Steroidobacteraceae bacterium]|jgi:septal ring factor EnvC (AmiA/AmiB activator)
MRLTIKRTAIWASFAAIAVFYGVFVAAKQPADSAQAKAKLAAVRSKIADLTNRMGKDLKQRDALSARLREAELAITAKRRHLDDLRDQQGEAEHHRNELLAEKKSDEAKIESERDALAAEVRAAYMIGRQEELKLFLNQDNPAAVGRTLEYYNYFAQQRSARIESIQSEVTQLEHLVGEIDAQNQVLKNLAEETGKEMLALSSARSERAESVDALSKRLASGNEELAKLKREEQAVEALVADLARVMQDFPTDSSKSFMQMRGKLPWPVAGRLAVHYQPSRGVLISAPRGAKVRAPYFGRVVYADWLQGLGLLLIIGHSGGFMTLYGHAEVLYKSVGDEVAPGDVIAAMPEAGADPKLYFEIREGRKTVDPKAWLKTTP